MDLSAPLIAGLTPLVTGYCLAIVFAAALIRGYSGFGFSALIVTGLSPVLPPAEVVPIAVLLEIAASLHLAGQVRKDVEWKLMAWLLPSAAITMPVGVYFLASVPVAPMRVVISVLVLIASTLIWRGFEFRRRPGNAATGATGAISGLLNGAAAIGGLPVMLFLISASVTAAQSRATMILFLMGMGVLTTAVNGANGLLTPDLWGRTAIFLLPLLVGNALGNRHFLKAEPESFRRFVLILLIGLSAIGLARTFMG